MDKSNDKPEDDKAGDDETGYVNDFVKGLPVIFL